MMQHNNPPQTMEEIKREIDLAKKNFDESITSIKQEFRTIIENLEIKQIKTHIKNVWMDPNES